MQKKRIRWLILPLLAALLVGAAGAADETEQVLLAGDHAVYTPVAVEPIEINGVPTLTKTYEMPPDFDPAALKEEPFSQGGYWYRYERMDKTVQHRTDTQDAEDTITIDAPSSDLATVIDRFSVTKSYVKEGVVGDLTLDLQSIKVEATGYKTVTDSHPHSVTKSYTLPYNDRSLVPETVQADGLSLPRTGLTWTETANVSDSDVPNNWTATAVYSKTTYTSRQVATGYQASAVYRGQIAKTSVDHVTYTVTYVGSKIPVMPFLDPDVTLSQIVIVCAAGVLLLVFLIVRYILWHTARVYVYNEERRIHDVVSRQFVRVRTPKIRLSALQGHAETEYTVILRRKLAKRLVGRDIAIETGKEAQHHVVESFVGSDYAFGVRI
ncbi:hypothetical protein [Agathobaculum sp.]|uniref:hypothetical protein n=1 Tax=Agathobaculum sp. TaxID=2048138 RepID=UPI003AB5D124